MKLIGIDLGTYNSCAVCLEDGIPFTIPNPDGARTTPSVVALTNQGRWVVGHEAKRQALTNPARTVQGVKRLIGRRFESTEVRAARKLAPYRIVEAPNGDAWVELGSRIYSPPEIEAVLLANLRAAAERYLGEPVDSAILSVPAYFNQRQRQATKDAAQIAGLRVSRVLNESTAAALAAGRARTREGPFAVYDLGGGTFDVSIVESTNGILQVLATSGDTFLGGVDFDELIVDWLARDFERDLHVDLRRDPMALQRLRQAAEIAKCGLSTSREAEIVLPFIASDERSPRHLNTVLTRSRFERMIEPMVDRTKAICRAALREARVAPEEITAVIAVGGQTRTPRVREAIADVFGKEPDESMNPDEAVAIGTAIQTGIIEGAVHDLVLLDATAHTLGIETQGSAFTPILERNSTIPTKKSRVFTTKSDGETRLEIHVTEGEGLTTRENVSLGRYVLEGLSPAPAGETEIEITFDLDSDGILEVSAREARTGRERSVTVHPTGGLTPDEIARASIEQRNQTFLAENLARRESLKSQLEALARSTRKSLDLLGSRLGEQERSRAADALRRAEEAGETSIKELEQALVDLNAAAEPLGREILDRVPPRGFFAWLERLRESFRA